MKTEQGLRELAKSWQISANDFSNDPVEKRVLLHCAEKLLLVLDGRDEMKIEWEIGRAYRDKFNRKATLVSADININSYQFVYQTAGDIDRYATITMEDFIVGYWEDDKDEIIDSERKDGGLIW